MNESVHNVSRETLDKLHRYQDLLNEWQEMMNLVARSTLPQMIGDAWRWHQNGGYGG